MTDSKTTASGEHAHRPTLAQFLRVPVTPPLEMVQAAAEAVDVIRPGDRLWHWFESYEDERDLATVRVDRGLIERSGAQKAFVMACIADLWSCMLDGARRMVVARSRRSTDHGDLLYFLPESMPEGGWPETKDLCTDAHRQHARYETEAFRPPFGVWDGIDPAREAVVPYRLTEEIAEDAARSYLSVGTYMKFEDVFDLSRTPFIPGMTKDHIFETDETHRLVLSRIWRECIDWVSENERWADKEAFPAHPDAQAEIVTHMVFRHRTIWKHVEDFIMKAPYDRFSIETDDALLTIAMEEGRTSYWYREREGHRFIRNEGLVLVVREDTTGLEGHLTRMAAGGVRRVEAIRLGEGMG